MAGSANASAPPAASIASATDSGTIPTTPKRKSVLAKYESLCYTLLGERIDRAGEEEVLSSQLKQAGINVTPGMYKSLSTVSTAIAATGGAGVSLLLFHVLLHPGLWWAYVLVITGVTAGSVYGGFRFLISTRIANRKDQLDRELPFTLSELSVLASTGASPIRLIRRMAQRDHDPALTGEFKRVIYKTDIQGKDLITALAETAKESPSPSVREAFWDLANMIHQGGNLDEYLRSKSDAVLQLKRLIQKQFIERLATFLDMYVALVLVGVLMIAVGAFLINSFGQTAAGLDADQLLVLLTFGMVPLAVIMTILMISVAYARAE
ncbi:MAG: type II secretion system F family protein [Thermoplasmata archaeon]